MERIGGKQEKMEGHFSTGQSPQWAVVPKKKKKKKKKKTKNKKTKKKKKKTESGFMQ